MAVHLTQEEAGLCKTPMREFLMTSPIQALINQRPDQNPSASSEDVITIWPVRNLFSSPSRETTSTSASTSGYSSDHEYSDEHSFDENLQQVYSTWELMPKVRTLSTSSTESTWPLKKDLQSALFNLYNGKRKSESSLFQTGIEPTTKRSRSLSPSERKPLVMKLKLCENGYKIVSQTSPTKPVDIEEPKIEACHKNSLSEVLVPAQLSPNQVPTTSVKQLSKPSGLQEVRSVAHKRSHDDEAKKRDGKRHSVKEVKKPKLDEEVGVDNNSKHDRTSEDDEKNAELMRSNLLKWAHLKHKSTSHSKRDEKDKKRSKQGERKREDKHKPYKQTKTNEKDKKTSRHDNNKPEKDTMKSKHDEKKDKHRSESKSTRVEKDRRTTRHEERKDKCKSDYKSKRVEKYSRTSKYEERKDKYESDSKSKRVKRDSRTSKYDEKKREDRHKSDSKSKIEEKREYNSKCKVDKPCRKHKERSHKKASTHQSKSTKVSSSLKKKFRDIFSDSE